LQRRNQFDTIGLVLIVRNNDELPLAYCCQWLATLDSLTTHGIRRLENQLQRQLQQQQQQQRRRHYIQVNSQPLSLLVSDL